MLTGTHAARYMISEAYTTDWKVSAALFLQICQETYKQLNHNIM